LNPVKEYIYLYVVYYSRPVQYVSSTATGWSHEGWRRCG